MIIEPSKLPSSGKITAMVTHALFGADIENLIKKNLW